MGSVCCCLPIPDTHEGADSDGSNDGTCTCSICCIGSFRIKWGALFCNRGMLAVPTSDQVPSSNSTVAAQISSDTDRSQNIPLANDTSPRYRQPNQDDVVTSFGGNTRVESYGEGGSKEWNSESPVGVLVAKVVAEVAYVLASEDEEDVCPTCLEEYTEENPRINTKCSHHYHLGCIYEWMERKETCPVCGKLMEFDETT